MKVNESANLKKAKRIFKNIDFSLLSKAVVGLFSTSSSQHGHDCIGMGLVAVDFLKRRGIDASIVVGECAWRVDGKSDGGVISHIGQGDGISTVIMPEGGRALPFHVWIKLNEYWFLDLTTYQFQMKMEQLNQDGQNVPVTWDPKFLLFTRSDISSYRDVQQSFSSKLIYYKERPDMRQMMESEVGVMEADKDDVDALEAIYRQLASGSLDLVIGPHGTVEYL